MPSTTESPELWLCSGTVFAREWGSAGGATILCWHGAGGSSADYARIGPGLADRLGARVVAIDGPGHARSSPRPPEDFRPSALAALTASMLDDLEVERPVFIGFSWGATIGCWFGALYPARTQALALVEGGHLDFTDLPDLDTGRTLEEFVDDAREVARLEGSSFGSHTPETAGAMIWGLCAEPATSTYARLAAAQVPVFFVGAQQGAAAAAVERMRRCIPGVETAQLATKSHDLLLDEPDELSRLVATWLASAAGSRPARAC